ncbi:MAG: CDP-glycerol glycerophosphotransferase family protein [Eubacterium sp.]
MNISGIKNKLKKNKLARVAKNYIFLSPYAKYYEKCRIEDNVILYESFYGKGMTCGPKAIFNELLADKKYIHVWVYDNKEEWRDNFEKYDLKENVKFVKIKSRVLQISGKCKISYK